MSGRVVRRRTDRAQSIRPALDSPDLIRRDQFTKWEGGKHGLQKYTMALIQTESQVARQ